MSKSNSIPVRINITKVILFLSSLFFSTGIILIFRTVIDWVISRSDLDFTTISDASSEVVLLIATTLLIVILLFPSNDQLNLSTIYKKRATFDRKRFFIYLFRLETSLILFLLIFFAQLIIPYEFIAIFFILIGLISVLFQTSYSKIHPHVNIVQSIKLRFLDKVDENLISEKVLSNATSGFLSQIFPSIENILLTLVMITILSLFEGIGISLIITLLLTLTTFHNVMKLSNRGNYFRKYVNLILSLYLIYQFTIILL